MFILKFNLFSGETLCLLDLVEDLINSTGEQHLSMSRDYFRRVKADWIMLKTSNHMQIVNGSVCSASVFSSSSVLQINLYLLLMSHTG